MITFSSAVKMFTQIANQVQPVINQINTAISAVIRFHRLMQAKINLRVNVSSAISQLFGKIKAIKQKINSMAGEFGNSLKKSVGNLLNFENGKKLFSSTVGGAMEQQQTRENFSVRTGNAQLGNAIYDQVAKQALQYGQNVGEAESSASSFMTYTMDPAKLTQMNKLAMRLSKLGPEEGLQGASLSMNELLSGDASSISEKFHIGSKSIESSGVLKAAKAGNVDGFIKGMDKLLNKQNMTEQAFEKMMESPSAQWQKAINLFKFNLGLAGQMALKAFGPMITTINEAFESGKLKSFFIALSTGLYLVVSLASWLVNAFFRFFDLVSAYLPEITTALGVGLVAALWSMVAPILAQAGAWLLANWPILLVMAAVGMLVFMLGKMGVTTDQIVGVVIGLFFSLFATLSNLVAAFWNILVSIGEFFANLFKDPVYAVKKLFYDLVKNIAEFFGNLINGIVTGLNKIIGMINKVSGKPIPLIPEISNDWVESLKPTTDKDVHDFSNSKMEFKDTVAAFRSGYSKGPGFLDSMGSAFDGLNSTYGGKIPNVEKVGEVGKINDTVDISSEDLKTMRELAEMKNIQNFVSLTPSVQVTTGPVGQESDINTIVARIETMLTEQIASSAQGVYR
ncbi:MAG: hypothetical protein K0R57_4800 [Paenibacillaceae bacterium]|jgi:hypothetical protein|nr:hypothetical protein [Paenibacillaceae bacterium]